jgi:hypothetical protein
MVTDWDKDGWMGLLSVIANHASPCDVFISKVVFLKVMMSILPVPLFLSGAEFITFDILYFI